MERQKRIEQMWILLPFLLLTACILTSCTSSRRSVNGSGGTPKGTGDLDGQVMTGIVTNVDEALSQITLRDLESDVETILSFDATSLITDKFDQEIAGESLEEGLLMEAVYSLGTAKIKEMKVPEDAWEYEEVGKFSFDTEEGSMKVAGKKYQYQNTTYISSSGSIIETMELNARDILTVRGIGYTVYSVVRTKGHGYIRLKNYDDFKGGMVEVGNQIILPVSDNMLITAGEGSYRLTLVKDKAIATKTVTVKSDDEVIVDFSDYVATAKNIGTIEFDIEPAGADLYINGTQVDYSTPIPLNYGEYTISVKMTGYDSYTGTLDVESAADIIYIDLIEEQAVVATSTPSTEGTSNTAAATAVPITDEEDDETTRTVDSEHTITITAPDDVDVYLDNVYKGVSPCSFTKELGSKTLTLSRSGYVTKSYSIEIIDDDEDVSLSFADLEKNDASG